MGIALALLAAGCEPRSFLPGGRLSGEPVTEPVTDFSFADCESGLQIEVQTGSWFPSSNIGCLVRGRTLYLFTAGLIEFEWLRALHADPRARIRIEGRLYDVRAVPLTEPAEIDPLLPALLRGFLGMEVEGAHYVGSSDRYPGTQIGINLFRVEPTR